jgi:hypothetical protein
MVKWVEMTFSSQALFKFFRLKLNLKFFLVSDNSKKESKHVELVFSVSRFYLSKFQTFGVKNYCFG